MNLYKVYYSQFLIFLYLFLLFQLFHSLLHRYQQEFVQGDDISVITSSEHDGGYSLIYEARRNASKLNQSFKTAKAYRKRIEACHYHQSKGLKKEPNDTNGPDLTTKIKELQIAIRNAERERAKAESRLEKLREGGINVDEYIDALVYTEEARDKAIASVSAKDTDRGATNAEWGASDTASNIEQVIHPHINILP